MQKFLKDLGAKHKFRDPLYGFIWLTDAEKEIIGTPMFQRLRRVHQLALTKYVYPGAEHSRFVHSIGAVHTATVMFAGVFAHRYTDDMSYQDRLALLKRLRFAALLHDIGHLPFSHAAEKPWLGSYLRHEDLSQYIILNYEPIRDVLDELAMSVSRLLGASSLPKDRLAKEIISGQLDADRADYLLRDSYYCGVKYGEFDWNRYSASFWTSRGALSVDEKDTYVAESFLMARYHYNLQVPFHRTRSGYDIALKKFLSYEPDRYQKFFTSDGKKIQRMDFDVFEDLDDYQLFQDIKEAKRKRACPWAKMLLREDRLKPIIDTTSAAKGGSEATKYKRSVMALHRSALVEDEDYFVQEQKVEIAKWLCPPDSENQMEPLNSLGWVEGPEKKMLTTCRECGIVRRSRRGSLSLKELFVSASAKDLVLERYSSIVGGLSKKSTAEELQQALEKVLADDCNLSEGEDYKFKRRLLRSSPINSGLILSPAEIPSEGTIWVKDSKGRLTDIKQHSWIFRQLSEEPLIVLRIFVTESKWKAAQSIIGQTTKGGMHE